MIPEHTRIEIKLIADAYTKGFTRLNIHPTKDSIIIWQCKHQPFALNGYLISEILRVAQISIEDIFIQSYYNGSIYVIAFGARGTLRFDEIAPLIFPGSDKGQLTQDIKA